VGFPITETVICRGSKGYKSIEDMEEDKWHLGCNACDGFGQTKQTGLTESRL
jgi:hypothetical protein